MLAFAVSPPDSIHQIADLKLDPTSDGKILIVTAYATRAGAANAEFEALETAPAGEFYDSNPSKRSLISSQRLTLCRARNLSLPNVDCYGMPPTNRPSVVGAYPFPRPFERLTYSRGCLRHCETPDRQRRGFHRHRSPRWNARQGLRG